MNFADRPPPRPRRLPRAATPEQFHQMCEDLIAEVRKSDEQYKWLFPSAYAKGRKGNGEKVRRDISGAGGDLADSFDTLDGIRRYLDQASDHQKASLAHAHGAGTALARCQDRIDKGSKPTIVAFDPLEPASPVKPFAADWQRGMTPSEARDWQTKRNARAAASQSPFAGEEITG